VLEKFRGERTLDDRTLWEEPAEEGRDAEIWSHMLNQALKQNGKTHINTAPNLSHRKCSLTNGHHCFPASLHNVNTIGSQKQSVVTGCFTKDTNQTDVVFVERLARSPIATKHPSELRSRE
jgi:hypothetical protein